MTWFVTPRLVNDVFSDPALLIRFRFGRRSILFDLGEIGNLSARELLGVSHIFISHAHMDHFAGFDRLLRFSLQRSSPIHILGPEGFIERVGHKLAAYTWNLLADGSGFSVVAGDFDGTLVLRSCRFRARTGFQPEPIAAPKLPVGVVLEDEAFRIECVALDHGIPSLAFAFCEKLRVNVIRTGLDRLGLPVGPWLNQAKRAVRLHYPDATQIWVGSGRSVELGVLKQEALRLGAGQRLAYVVDAAYHCDNIDRIIALAHGADQLFIETAFLHSDAALAAERRHLTTVQAATIARLAGVSQVVPLHFSPRYRGREDIVRQEVELAFRGVP
jgi:ribonuclease Z